MAVWKHKNLALYSFSSVCTFHLYLLVYLPLLDISHSVLACQHISTCILYHPKLHHIPPSLVPLISQSVQVLFSFQLSLAFATSLFMESCIKLFSCLLLHLFISCLFFHLYDDPNSFSRTSFFLSFPNLA